MSYQEFLGDQAEEEDYGYYSGEEDIPEEMRDEETSGDGYDSDDPVMDINGSVVKEKEGPTTREDLEDDDSGEEEEEVLKRPNPHPTPRRKVQCTHILAGGPNKGSQCTVNVLVDGSFSSEQHPKCSKHKKRKRTPTSNPPPSETLQPRRKKKKKATKKDNTAPLSNDLGFHIDDSILETIPDGVCRSLESMGIKTGVTRNYLNLPPSKRMIKNIVNSQIVSYGTQHPRTAFFGGLLGCLAVDNRSIFYGSGKKKVQRPTTASPPMNENNNDGIL